jgi:Ca2+-binding RTX toxin-like protein
MANEIANYLKYANVQIAAEAFFNLKTAVPGTTFSGLLTGANLSMLTAGNDRSSRFTTTQADQFSEDWEVVEHKSNTATGFSGTLLRARRTDEVRGIVAGELVLSFRSTEFADDAVRDSQATNSMEIKEKGWAFGQISDMESWYASLKLNNQIPSGASFSVTGYSLGGHLATAFNLLRQEDGTSGRIAATYTFNGAGVGNVISGTLTQTIQTFKTIYSLGAASQFMTVEASTLYQQLKNTLSVHPSSSELSTAKAAIADAIADAQINAPNATYDQIMGEYGLLKEAVRRAMLIADERDRVATISNSGLAPLGTALQNVDAVELDYQLGVLIAAKNTKAYPLADMGNPESGIYSSAFDRRNVALNPISNFYDIYASNRPSAVANSQLHYGTIKPIRVEDQPLMRGSYVSGVVGASILNWDVKLLTNNFGQNDFGDTHSLVLLVDSLAVQDAFARLDVTFTSNKAAALIDAATNTVGQTTLLGQGKAEGDALDNLVVALAKQLGVAIAELKPNLSGNTWFEREDQNGTTGRNALHAALNSIANSDIYKSLVGKIIIQPVGGNLAAQAKARIGFEDIVALQTLSPFVINAAGDAGKTALDGLWQSAAWNQRYTDWLQDRSRTSLGKPALVFTDQWIEDRGAMLGWLIKANQANFSATDAMNRVIPISNGFTVTNPLLYEDRTLAKTLLISGRTETNLPTKRYVFGTAADETDLAGGAAEDHLYGGDGNDSLEGKAGADYLEGNTGNDTLDGGADNDTLAGGQGSDLYKFFGTFGKDTIIDSDGRGTLSIDGISLSGGRANVHGTWAEELSSGQIIQYQVVDNTASTTGKQLVISKQGDITNTVTVNNFDLSQAFTSAGYLGIKLDPNPRIAVTDGTGSNLWSDLGFVITSLLGKLSNILQGGGRQFTTYLDMPAKAGETVTLNLVGISDKFKVILGDRVVNADGAVITLAEGQTDVSFALVQEGDVANDVSGSLSVSYQGEGRSATSNVWAINLTDIGETTKTFLGDQHGRFLGSTVENGVTLDYYASTEWAADGQVIDGEAEEDFNDVIAGSTGNDKISGKGGNDALDGGAGNDEINGDAGDDVIIGGAGSDTLNGGDGNDFIFGAGDLMAPQTVRTHGWSPTLANVGVAGTSDDASDVIDAGDGNDVVFAGRGGDRIEGGAGNDQLWGLAGDDIIEGGSGDDALYGDGINASGSHATTLANDHGNDFLDGGDGNDVILGYGKNDSLFGGAGNDSLWGDAVASELAGEYHGNDYLDGEDGDDRLWGNGGKDTLYGGDGDDELQGDASGSALAGQYHGDDYLDGEGGDDHLWGDGGNDTLYGGDGDDELSGDASDLAGEYHGDDYIDGEGGNDFLWGGGGSDTLVGGAGDDEIYADTGVLISDAGYLAGEYHGDDSIDAGDGDDYAEGNGGNDSLKGGAGSDQLWGDAALVKLEAEFHGTDFLDGGDGDDYLTGGGKSDTLYGGAGNDFLWGDDSGEEGDDHYIPGSFHGDDYLDGGEGDDQLVGDGGNDTLIGGAGKDKLFGDDPESRLAGEFHGEDYLDGGDGDDYAEGGGNDDTILGGKGDDILWGDALESKISLELHGDDYLDGGEGADKLYGGGGDDILLGGDGDDTLYGEAGDDHLEGGAGDDILMGGDGDDTLIDTEGNNTFDGGAGDDSITVGDMDNNLQGGEGNDTLIAGDGDNTLDGGSGADQLTAGDGDNTMNGDEGNDTITSGSGNDTLNGGEGNDSLSAGDGNNTLSGDEGNDTITSGSGNDILNGGEGNDSLSAGDGNNALSGDGGNDTITSGSGNDALNGGEGNDVLTAGDGNNTVQGGDGNDSLTSGAGTDNLNGGNGNDTLHAGGGNDVLNGGNGDDMLYGEGGDDLLYASRGNDTLAGGDGLDTYVLGYGADRNTVVDDSAEGSIIKLGAAGMKFEDLTAVRRANDLVVEVRGTSASMRIKDYYASTQTSWVFEDAQGNTATGEALVAASQTDWAQLQANLLKDFQSSSFGSISRGYSDGGYTQRVDGSWFRADSYAVDISKTYGKRTEYFKNLSGVTSSYVSVEGWDGDLPSQRATDTTAMITFQTNVVASGTDTLQAYNYSSSFQNAWSAVHWTKDSSSHFGSEWQAEYGTDGSGSVSLNGYTRVDVDTDYYTGTTNQLTFQDPGPAAQAGNLPGYVAVDFLHQQFAYNLGPSILADGDQTVSADGYSAVIGGIGNNTIYGAGFAYGGTGNAQLIGGGTLMAGTGDQYLENGRIMVVGDGHDTVVGGGQILVNPDNLGIDLIGQDFDWENDNASHGQSEVIDAIYQAMGYGDWARMYQHGGKFNLVFGEGYGKYYDSIEDARAAFVPSEYWPTFDIAMADPYTRWSYVEPLTVLYKTPYTRVEEELVASDYYDSHPLAVTVLTANDFATLQPLIDAELLFSSVITFGPGLVLGDLTLSWGEAVAPLDGVTHVTLDILWGPDQGIRILMPRSGDALNSVAQQFEFADGTVSTLLDLIALAPPAPDFDTGYSRIFSGMGEQSVDAADVAGIRAAVASAGELKIESDGVDLLISIIGSSGDSLRISGWYADSGTMPQAILFTSGGAVLSATEMTGKGLIKDGSAGDLDLFGVPGFATTFIAGPNTRMTGASGMDIYVYNAGSGEVHITDPGGGAVRFGSGISATATLGLAEGSLVINLGGQGDIIHLENFDPNDAENFSSVLDLRFADGSVLNLQDLIGQGFDLSGTSDADTMTGTSVTDRMLAGAGDDVLQGGRGDDTLGGGAGSDVYLFSRGDGLDTVNEDDSTAGNVDTIRFDDTVSVADVRVNREGFSLYLSMDGSTDRIEISNWFADGADTVEQVEFADGTVWNKADLEARLPTLITGTEGDEELNGSDAFEILDGQAGNDLLSGGAGNDVYLFKRGDGQDIIDEYDETVGNIDAIRFDSGISAADVRVTRDSYGHLFLGIDGTQDRIQLSSWFESEAYQVERVLFADGTVWKQEDLAAMAQFGPSEGSDYLEGTEDGEFLLGLGGADELYGLGGNDIIAGGSGNDALYGGQGDDLLDSGTGDDWLNDEGGNDVYLYSRGDGSDRIDDYDETSGNVDTLRFYDGTISASDIKVTRNVEDLYLDIAGTSDRITLGGWFIGGGSSQIEQIEFYDGTVWNAAMLESLVVLGDASENPDELVGTSGDDTINGLDGDDDLMGVGGDDTLDGGAGNDYLTGGAGSDVYLFGRGSGQDVIQEFTEAEGGIDTLRFDSTVEVADITVTRDDDGTLSLSINGTDDRVQLNYWFSDSTGQFKQVERVEFADGTVWNTQTLADLAVLLGTSDQDFLPGSQGNDLLRGLDGNDILFGGDGSDVLEGGAGNDSLSDMAGSSNYFNGGSGDDQMLGSTGANLLIGGTGNDAITSDSGPDVIAFNVGDGQDTLYINDSQQTLEDTISLGGAGLDYANLSLQKNGDDLVLKVSGTDQLTLTDWYAGTPKQSVLNLQLVSEAMAAFDANSSDPLLNKKVQTFDFQGLVGAFDAARTATPGLSSWALSNGLTQFHLAGSDSEALGGDLAYHYGADGTLAGMGLGKAQDVLTNAQFGAQAQAIHSTASLQEGLVRLG